MSAQSIEARCWVENEDVVGAAPTGDAPTTSEWSTILLPTVVRLILKVLRYVYAPANGTKIWCSISIYRIKYDTFVCVICLFYYIVTIVR